MLTVEDYAEIRRARRDGMTIRAIAKKFRRSRRKVREALANPEPKGYTRTKPVNCPMLGKFHDRIDEILEADKDAPPKQRHTAAQIFRELVGDGSEGTYKGGYDQIRRYVGSRRRIVRETFLPLDHQPGQRGECDFGHIQVDFPDGRRSVAVLLVAWAYSYRTFAIALPSERVESILHGMRTAFEFFDCLPKEVWWDNPTTVATAVLSGRQRKINPRYMALASHYNFEPLFCMPARGNEKPHAENRVKNLQRRWATPVPRVKDMDELNDHLRRCCQTDCDRVVAGQSETIGVRFEQERPLAVPLPERSFDACIREYRKIDKYQTAAFDNNRYSVPRRFAFKTGTVKAYVDKVEIVINGTVVARHQRSYGKGQHVLDPLHYLTLLDRKPAYLDHTAVFKNWKLPAAFNDLRERLEARHGPFDGSRQFARVLQLLGHNPVKRVARAIEQCRENEPATADRIATNTERLRLRELHRPQSQNDTGGLPSVNVPLPNLKCFDSFLHQSQEQSTIQHLSANGCADGLGRELQTGGLNHVEDQRSLASIENEPQATAVADDPGGVREAQPGGGDGRRGLSAVLTAPDGNGVGHATVRSNHLQSGNTRRLAIRGFILRYDRRCGTGSDLGRTDREDARTPSRLTTGRCGIDRGKIPGHA